MFIGAHVLSQDSPTVTVWQASRDLSIGATPMHLQPVTVALGSVAADYVPVDEQPVGRLRIPITEGELLPRSALASDTEQASRIVTVGVEPLHAPIDLASGDRVDVWSTAEQGASPMAGPELPAALPTLVLANVLVEAVSVDSMGGQLAVVVRVAPDQVATLVQAARAGLVDLVSVPSMSQEMSQSMSQEMAS